MPSNLRMGMVDLACDRIKEIARTNDLSEVEVFELLGEMVSLMSRYFAEERRSNSPAMEE